MILSADQILDDQMVTGDHYRLTYSVKVPIFETQQAQILVYKLKQEEPRIGNVTYEVRKADREIVIEFDVVKNPIPLIAVLTTISVVAGGIFLFLSLDRVEKITRSPAGAGVLIGVLLLAGFILNKYGGGT